VDCTRHSSIWIRFVRSRT